MAKLVLNDLVYLTNEASAVALINSNSSAIEAAVENTLSRDGTTPNQMSADIDLNSNDLLNVGTIGVNDVNTNTLEANNATVGIINATTSILLNGVPIALAPLGGGLPVGGSSGQVLTKIDSTNYNTYWATPVVNPGGTGTVTSFSIVAANGFSGSVSNASTTPALTITTSVTGIVKGNGTALSAATAGTDYQAPISLTTTGTGAATLISNVLNIPTPSGGGSGTVTTVSVASSNGFAGTVATATTTPVITLTTTISGILKGSGSALVAATAGTDYIVPGGALGTPSSGVATNLTGTAAGLTAGTVTTNANLTGDVTSVGNTTTLTNAPVIAKVLTGYVSGAGTVAATDSILQAIQKLNGNDATNANLTGVITSVGNTTSIASQTGTGTTLVTSVSPAFTGTPTAPTPSANDDSTKLATTAYVDNSAIGGAIGGRLTALTGTAVMTSTVSGATSVFFTPYKGQYFPVWDGAKYVNVFYAAELSQLLSDTTKSPAAAAASSVYDIYGWNDAGTIRISRGPAWSSSSVRGAPANLTRWKGIEVNATAITNGPAQLFGTYLGTIATNASATLDFIYGGSASGGSAASLNVWNYYNKVMTATFVFDTGASYTYTSATIRQARGSTGNQIGFVSGLREDGYTAFYQQNIQTAAALNATALAGIGVNSTTVYAAGNEIVAPTAAVFKAGMTTQWQTTTQIGTNVIAAIESSDGTNANSFCVFGGAQLSFSFLM